MLFFGNNKKRCLFKNERTVNLKNHLYLSRDLRDRAVENGMVPSYPPPTSLSFEVTFAYVT